MQPILDIPWEKIGIDIFHWNQEMYLLIVDYFSKYPKGVKLPITTSEYVINVLKQIFSRHEIPQKAVTGNDVQFISLSFRKFANDWNFKHTRTSPNFSQLNGMVEGAIQTIKILLKKV